MNLNFVAVDELFALGIVDKLTLLQGTFFSAIMLLVGTSFSTSTIRTVTDNFESISEYDVGFVANHKSTDETYIPYEVFTSPFTSVLDDGTKNV